MEKMRMSSPLNRERPAPDDWRRQAQEEYLMGARLRLMRWRMSRPGWDHDHCEFCSAKLSNYEGDLHEGYTTDDEYNWICPKCFEDFCEEFRWTVEPGAEPESGPPSSAPGDH